MSNYWLAEAGFDWERYVSDRGGMPALRSKREEYVLECSDCGRDKLAVNVKRHVWQCFVCSEAGRTATSLVAKVDSLMWHQAMAAVLTGHQQVIGRIDQITSILETGSTRPPNWIPKVLPWPDSFESVGPQSPIGQAGMAYCIERGIPDYVAYEMKLGVCRFGRWSNRLIFPVFDSGGRLIFYQGRAMWKPRPFERHIKTLSPKVFDKEKDTGAGDVLLNLSYVANSGCERVIVVEGPVDCAHAWPDAVASFGKHLTGRQIELLMRIGVKEIDLCFDRDVPKKDPKGQLIPGGAEAMMAAAPVLADIFTVRIVHLPFGKDPGDFTKDEIEHYRSQALVWGTGERLQQIPYTLTP